MEESQTRYYLRNIYKVSFWKFLIITFNRNYLSLLSLLEYLKDEM